MPWLPKLIVLSNDSITKHPWKTFPGVPVHCSDTSPNFNSLTICRDKKIFIGDHILYTETLFNYLTHNFNYLTPNFVLFRVQFLTYRWQCFDVMHDILLCLTLSILGLTLSHLIGGTKYFLCKMRPINSALHHLLFLTTRPKVTMCIIPWNEHKNRASVESSWRGIDGIQWWMV